MWQEISGLPSGKENATEADRKKTVNKQYTDTQREGHIKDN